jgi:hypothetical protein
MISTAKNKTVSSKAINKMCTSCFMRSAFMKIRNRCRYWGQSGHRFLRRTCLLLTQSGHDDCTAKFPLTTQSGHRLLSAPALPRCLL